jgi:outer membrane protein assembly factor BamB
MKNRQIAMVAAGILAGIFATNVRAEGGEPVISPPIDEAMLARAKANGEALLGKAKWKVEVPNGTINITAAGQTVFCQLSQSANSGVTALDAKTGNKRWDAGATVPKGMADRVEAAAATQPLGGIAAQPRWGVLLRLQEEPNQPDLVYLEGGDPMRLCALAEETGKRTVLWTRSAVGDAADGVGGGRPPLGAPYGDAEVATITETHVILGGRNTLVGEGGPMGTRVGPLRISCFDRKTGEPQWSTEVPGGAAGTSKPVVADGRVYVMVDQAGSNPEPKSFLMTLNLTDGKELWSTPVEKAALCAPVVAGALVLTASQNAEAIAYDAQTGKEKWRSAISPDCDVAKSKLTSMSMNGVQLCVDEERVVAPVVGLDNSRAVTTTRAAGLPVRQGMGAPRAAAGVSARGLAVFDIKSGKQTGYFNGKLERTGDVAGTTNRSVARRPFLRVYKGTIVWNGDTGVDLKTLRLGWRIETQGLALARDTLYISEKGPGDWRAPVVIRAVPLDAWAEVKAGK